MNASVGRQFYYHSDASPVGGHITHPFQQVVTTNASSSLAQAGGVVTANHDSYRLDPIVSADRAYSHISGAKNDNTGNWTTLTTSVVENLNVLEVVTADRIVGRLAVEHPAVGYTPKVSYVGVQFDNLRINGKRIHVKINFKLLDDDHVDRTTGFPDRPFTRNDNFIKKVTEQSRRITEAEGAPEWLKARYGWVQSAEERDKRGYAICSLVEELGVEDGSGSVPYGHIIPVPEFGNLFLGELSDGSKLLPAYHDADGTRMPGGRNPEFRFRRFKWESLSVALGVLALTACIGCRRKPQMAPDAVYARIENELISGDLPEARFQAKEAYDSFASSRPDWAAAFRIELGKVLIYQGAGGDALLLLQEPLPAQSSIELQVRRCIFLAFAQARLGHLDQAEQSLLEAEHLKPEGALRAEALSTRGSIDLEKGDLDDAERAFQASLAGARLNGDRFLQMRELTNLGIVALREEHYEDALARFGEASALARIIGAKMGLEKAVGNIGFVYYKTGDFQRSLTSSIEAEKQAAELGAPIDQGHWLDNAGLSEYRLGDLDAARSFYERSLSLAQSIQNQEEILDAHVDLGFLLLRLNKLDEAEVHVREANSIAALRKSERAGLEPLLLNALLLDKRGDRQGSIKTLLQLEGRAADVPSLRWEAESTLARTYIEDGRKVEAGRWFQRSIETFRRQRSSLTSVESTLPFLENGSDLYTGYTDYLIREHRADEALSVVDQSRAEALADGLGLSPSKGESSGFQRTPGLNARAIAARLQATILVYSLRPKVSYLWAISPARQQFYELPGSEVVLPLIQSHTKAILASKDVLAQRDAPGRDLYEALVRPAEGLIRRGGRVFIVGDEGLSGLNFETLLAGEESPHFWIEDVTITNAKSLRLLAMSKGRETRYADKRMLLIGDPVYREAEYARLPNASSEVANIAGHFAPDHRMVLTGAQATPEAYQSHQPGEFSYIHFVAHATANMTAPLDSAVVLSRSQEGVDAYKLYAREILRQNLHADLVTLSACYGSGTRQYTGEGLVGLAWAFLRAGSHHVIGAMWEVSDASTPLLMDHLYGELAKGSQPDAALRAAKLEMIHSSGVFRKPLYWAPFQLYAGA